MRRTTRFVISAILLLACITSISTAQDVILGVLEEVPGTYYGEASSRKVRVVFEKARTEWAAYPTNCLNLDCFRSATGKFPTEINWNVSFDGRLVGQVTGRTQDDFRYYSHVGLQDITSNGPVPTVGTKSSEYSGFLSTPVYRPLVAISEPHFKDPDSWKPAQLDNPSVNSLRRAFRERSPKLCRDSKEDETKLEPFPYADDEIKVLKAYSSNKRWSVVRLHLETAIDCEDVEAGFEIPDRWFAIDPHGTIRYLDQAMWLVDAGDYDNDGRSELMFSIDDYNRGGYRLFYDDFKKHAEFKFGYH